jgi:hypothetical protein
MNVYIALIKRSDGHGGSIMEFKGASFDRIKMELLVYEEELDGGMGNVIEYIELIDGWRYMTLPEKTRIAPLVKETYFKKARRILSLDETREKLALRPEDV